MLFIHVNPCILVGSHVSNPPHSFLSIIIESSWPAHRSLRKYYSNFSKELHLDHALSDPVPCTRSCRSK